tara:strand:+ start:872 stop:1774 length:903 start_codon:yes stop_codon:yes gene_type:complete
MIKSLKNIFSDKGKRKIVLFFLIIISFLVVFMINQKKEMEKEVNLKIQFIEEKNILRDELDDIIDEHDDLLDEYGDLNDQLQDKDSVIQQQILQIKNLIRTENDLREARRKIETLKTISKKYLANIDSLLILNTQLSEEKDSVINVNKNINWKNYKLNQQNEELTKAVNKGSVLSIEDIQVETIKYKSTGREALTKQAKKTQKFRVCFNIEANPIAKSEMKQAYLQLIDPKGNVLFGEEVRTELNSETVFCTAVSEFYYKNIQLAHCLEWERIQILEKGNYIINIIIENNIAGQLNIRLK